MTDLVERMREELRAEPHRRLWIALHEAGHEKYARRAGAIDIKYEGPQEYPGRPGEYGPAGIKPVFPPSGARMDALTMAHWYCAGAVMQKVLAPASWEEEADATDYAIFGEQLKLLTGGKVTETDISGFWKVAQKDVERDLRSPAFRREMWDLAREVEKKIPWDL